MHHLLPTFTKAATTRTNSETHPSKNATMVNFGTLMHIMHRCPYQQQIGPLIHTPTYKHFGTNTSINASCSTVCLLYLGNVLRQCEVVELSMRFFLESKQGCAYK